MHPIFMFLLAILTPFLLLAVLLIPIYATMYAACYVIYMPHSGVHPLANQWADVFTILDVYQKLAMYWLQHMHEVSFLHYSLPLIALPPVGVGCALYMLRWLVRKLVDIFHLGVGSH